jgi:hypothetical protein
MKLTKNHAALAKLFLPESYQRPICRRVYGTSAGELAVSDGRVALIVDVSPYENASAPVQFDADALKALGRLSKTAHAEVVHTDNGPALRAPRASWPANTSGDICLPDLRQVLPEHTDAHVSVTFDAKLLRNVCDVLDRLGCAAVTLSVDPATTTEKPAILSSYSYDGDRVTGALMPYQCSKNKPEHINVVRSRPSMQELR